jgi:hypothetical protein
MDITLTTNILKQSTYLPTAGWTGRQHFINNDGYDCFTNELTVTIGWSVNAVLYAALFARCFFIFHSKILDNKSSTSKKVLVKSESAKSTVSKPDQEESQVEGKGGQMKRQNTQQLQAGAGGRKLSIKEKLMKADIATKLSINGMVLAVAFIVFDIIKLTSGQIVGDDVAITIFFIIGGVAFWNYTTNFAFNLIQGSLTSSMSGKSKEIQNLIRKIRIFMYMISAVSAIACLGFIVTLAAGKGNWELQQGVCMFHYITLGTLIVVGVSLVVYFTRDIVAKLKDAAKALDVTKETDKARKEKYDAVIARLEFFIGQFISNAFTNSIVAFAGAIPWMHNKIEYLLMFAWTAAAAVVISFTFVLV